MSLLKIPLDYRRSRAVCTGCELQCRNDDILILLPNEIVFNSRLPLQSSLMLQRSVFYCSLCTSLDFGKCLLNKSGPFNILLIDTLRLHVTIWDAGLSQ